MSSNPTTSVSGLVSGIDWDTTIKQLMTIERLNRVRCSKAGKTKTRPSSAFGADIQGKVSYLQSTMQGMDQRSGVRA